MLMNRLSVVPFLNDYPSDWLLLTEEGDMYLCSSLFSVKLNNIFPGAYPCLRFA